MKDVPNPSQIDSHRYLRPSITQTLIRWLLRPIVTGNLEDISDDAVFVLLRRSRLDVALLRNITHSHSTVDQLDGVDFGHFYLMRPAGWRRRFVQRGFSNQMEKLQESLIESEDESVQLVPVSFFWGRTAHRKKSLIRTLISEKYGPTLAFRKVKSFLVNRTDILVNFGQPIDWNAATDSQKSLNWNLRHISLLLRKQFKETRHASLGPDLNKIGSTVEGVLEDIEDGGATELTNRREIKREIRRMASRLSYPVMKLVRFLLNWYFKRVYEGIEFLHVERLDAISKTHTLIYAPNHRSQTDYLVLSFMLFQHGFAIPQVASGDNLNVPVVGPILRRCGGFFMRRSFRDDPIYENVLASYLHLCVQQGHNIEFFVEGGRSRSGLMLKPRFGLLNMILASRERGLPRPLAVVPVYISYESVVESETYLTELSGKPKTPESVRDVIYALKLLRSNLGKVQIHVGEPVQLDQVVTGSDLGLETEKLGRAITHGINDAAVLTGVNLSSLVLLTSQTHTMDESSFTEKIRGLLNLLRQDSAHHDLYIPNTSAEELIERSLQLKVIRRESVEDVPVITCDDYTAQKLTWLRNNILHVVAIPALIANTLVNRGEGLEMKQCVALVHFLEPFVCNELNFSSSLRTVRRWIRHMEQIGLVLRSNTSTLQAATSYERRRQLRFLSDCTMSLLSRFYVTLATVVLNPSQQMDRENLTQSAYKTCRLLAHLERNEFASFVEKSFFDRLVEAMIERSVLLTNEEQKLLPSSNSQTIMEEAKNIFPLDYRQRIEQFVMA